MVDETVIRVRGLSKRYGLPLVPYLRSLWHRAVQSGSIHDDTDSRPLALQDVTFDVKRGETLGIVGRNGAGKSTLVKILAGVSPPTRGMVNISGRIFPLIELNAGLHVELTGRENVRLLGSVMGLSRNRVEHRMPDIEEFCELGSWFDRPVRTYSSGMLARLGFGVAIHVDADVLLIDEVLSVGDFSFQKKCISRIAALSGEGRTIIFVSHNPYMVERVCDRALLLNNGRIQEVGDPSDVMRDYFALFSEPGPTTRPVSGDIKLDNRAGTGDVRITRVEVIGQDGQPTQQVNTGEQVTLRLHYSARERVEYPTIGIRIYDPQNSMVLSFASTAHRRQTTLSGSGHIDCIVENLSIMPNVYTIQVKVAGDITLDVFESAVQFSVVARPEQLIASANMGIAFSAARWNFGNDAISRREETRDR